MQHTAAACKHMSEANLFPKKLDKIIYKTSMFELHVFGGVFMQQFWDVKCLQPVGSMGLAYLPKFTNTNQSDVGKYIPFPWIYTRLFCNSGTWRDVTSWHFSVRQLLCKKSCVVSLTDVHMIAGWYLFSIFTFPVGAGYCASTVWWLMMWSAVCDV